MSAEAIRAVAALSVTTSVAERTLLMILAQEADPKGYVVSTRASQPWLAQQCGWLRIESVRVTAKRLAERGLLEVLAAGRPGAPATYRLPFVRSLSP